MSNLSKKQKVTQIKFGEVIKVIQSKDLVALRTLLQNKHIELIDKKQETVLHSAARLGDVDVINMLLRDWRVAQLLDSEMYNGDTPLVAAARMNNVEAVQTLADHHASLWRISLEGGTTILHFAASVHDSDLLSALIARNPPHKVLNKPNGFGESALEVALMHHPSNVQVLLQAGADFHKPNEQTGRNVLHISVAYGKCFVLQDLLASQKSRELTNMTDRRGDTPLMLAIRVACLSCVQLLIKYVKVGKEINEITGESLLHLAVQTDRNDILSDILMFSNDHVINYKDSEGRTPLLLAIEESKNQCLRKLINTQNVYEKNSKTQDTALHMAIKVNNRQALKLLMENNQRAGSWCFSQQNRDGKTPLWVAVECDNAYFVAEARKGRLVNVEQLNQHGDSSMYVAASWGNIHVLKTLLLSDKFYSFCRTYEKPTDFTGKRLVKEAEISCDIYSSDIFILTEEIRKNRSHTWFPKTFFSVNKKTGRNIFHACALSGNVHCLDFIYIYIRMFNQNVLPLFDQPDLFGNTPIQLATTNDIGGPECVYYFLVHHADISNYNKKGVSVLESILKNTEHSTDLLTCVLDEAITYDQEVKGLQEQSESLKVNFSILRPAEPIIKVVKLFYDTTHGEQKYKLLQHSLFKIYVHLVLMQVNYFFVIRFLLSLISTFLLTVFIGFYSRETTETPRLQYLRYILRILNVLGLFFSVPLLFHNKIDFTGLLTTTLLLTPCLLVLWMTTISHASGTFYDTAAVAVLIAFFSLMMYSTTIFRNISHQMAMLSQVIYGMIKYAVTVFLVLWAFSSAFYCIFDNGFYFVNPFKSLIYTSTFLLLDETSESFDFFQDKHSLQNISYSGKSDEEKKTIYESFASQLDLYFECSIILAFIIMVNLALMNMLVSLAVREGNILEASGSIFRRHLQICWLSSLEMFLGSFVYKIVRHTPLVYLLGLIPSRTLLDVAMVYYPMYEHKYTAFTQRSIRELKRTRARTGSPRIPSIDIQRAVAVLPKRTIY